MRARMAYCGPRGIPLSQFLSWPVDDQAAALLWQAEENLRCRECGTAEWEWMENLDAYEAKASTCPGCQKIAIEKKQWEKTAEHQPGIKVRLVAREAVTDGAN